MKVWKILLITVGLLLMAGLAFCQQPAPPPLVTLDSVTCFSDWRFHDGWGTTTTASWEAPAEWRARYLNVEVFAKVGDRWLPVGRVPVGAQSMDVSGLAGGLRFYLVDYRNGRAVKMPARKGLEVLCDPRPIPEGSAWVWDGHSFELAIVDVIEWVN
jgi:hypothetical protein